MIDFSCFVGFLVFYFLNMVFADIILTYLAGFIRVKGVSTPSGGGEDGFINSAMFLDINNE